MRSLARRRPTWKDRTPACAGVTGWQPVSPAAATSCRVRGCAVAMRLPDGGQARSSLSVHLGQTVPLVIPAGSGIPPGAW